ncbi:osmolarity response regulator [Hartmannibacter diazotrophicus]|uniref:Osmolarity response regulator n=1 Tax=Hartmannibacter diazotrophicus TaxID=1482074 RepID=A0A2C9D0R4_9HYPH|nr:response regulator [Hartmannibacter diazotrophicus]SON53967.1 osmolarity response regulator [Hartmannibacter diazotrophicus]
MNIGLGDKRRMILLVDADAHARAVMRNALEAAGFSVGEAVNAREGERTLNRIRPDAILADLMIESIEADGGLTDTLAKAGSEIPIYVVSNAADALVGAVGLQELGVSGVFVKPADPAIVVQTLKTRLGVT